MLNKDDINTVPFVVSQKWNLLSESDVYLLPEQFVCGIITLALTEEMMFSDHFTFTLKPL